MYSALIYSPEIASANHLAALQSGWLEWLNAADASPDTRFKYGNTLKAFYVWLYQNNLSLGQASRRDVCQWRDERLGRYSANTVKQNLAAIRSFYNWAVEEELADKNPAAGVKCKGAGAGTGRQRDELTDDEMTRLLETCDFARDDVRVAQRDRAILYLKAYCNLRDIEVQRADREDLRQKGGRVILWVQGKGHREPDEYVVLPPVVEQVLRDWLAAHPAAGSGPLFVSLSRRTPNRRLTANYIRRMVKNRLRQCGIDSPTKTSHSLRHSAITRMLRGGASLAAVRVAARHRKVDTTLLYIHDSGRLSDPAEDRISYGEESQVTGR